VLRVVTVMRSGGEFKLEHARALREQFAKHITVPHEFICLTDTPGHDTDFWPLLHDWPGWWSMLEMFRVVGPALYVDLDAVVIGNLDHLAVAVCALAEDEAILLHQLTPNGRPSRRWPWTTGVTAWGGDLRPVYEEFVGAVAEGAFHTTQTAGGIKRAGGLITTTGAYANDERWTPPELVRRGIKLTALQDAVPGVVQSYKFHVLRSEKAPVSPLVMFHGRPRPWELDPMPEWMP